jgi:hypothetical protein
VEPAGELGDDGNDRSGDQIEAADVRARDPSMKPPAIGKVPANGGAGRNVGGIPAGWPARWTGGWAERLSGASKNRA